MTFILHPTRRAIAVACLALAMSAGRAQSQVSTVASGRNATVTLDTAAILASARPAIDSANNAWIPGLRQHDAPMITSAYADSGLFIAGDGTVTRGRDAITRMYAAVFPRMRTILDGAVVQDGLTVLGPTRIVEWGHAWLEMQPAEQGGAIKRSGGPYLTVWERAAGGRWRITRNIAF